MVAVGGAIAGGLLLLAAVPTSVTIAWPVPLGGAVLVLWMTSRASRRLAIRR